MASRTLVALGLLLHLCSKGAALGARQGLSCALAEHFVVLPMDSHSWTFGSFISL